jgi:ribonuclease Z
LTCLDASVDHGLSAMGLVAVVALFLFFYSCFYLEVVTSKNSSFKLVSIFGGNKIATTINAMTMMTMVVPTTTVSLNSNPSRGIISTSDHNPNISTKVKKGNKGGGGDDIVVTGRSRAGQATSWSLPRYKTIVDVGCIIEQWIPKTVLLTHTHSDHVQCIMDIINRLPPVSTKKSQQQQQQQPKLKVYLPIDAEPFVRNYISAAQSMYDCGIDNGADTDSDDDYVDNDGDDDDDDDHGQNNIFERIQLCPVEPGDVIELGNQSDRLQVIVLKMTHRIPCVGYSFVRQKRKLKSQYVGLPGREIGELIRKKKSSKGGDDDDDGGIYEMIEEPLICIMGDTTSQIFHDYPHILQQHSFVVVECTFLESKDRSRAEITKHMLWQDLEPFVSSHPDTMFLLTHFSLKHSTLSIRQQFCEIQKTYNNVHPMIIEEEVEQQWSSKAKVKSMAKSKDTTTTGNNDCEVDGDDDPSLPPTCQCRMCVGKTMQQ